MHVPDYLKDFDKTDREIIEERQEQLHSDMRHNIKDTPQVFDRYFGVTSCTSCRKWWPALFIGASIGTNFSYSVPHMLLSIILWGLFWKVIHGFINHESNNLEKHQEFKGMEFMRTIDAILGARSQNFIYYVCLIMCIVIAVPWYLPLKLIAFPLGWMIGYIAILMYLPILIKNNVDTFILHNRK